MKIYESISEYLKEFRAGDKVIFGGHGIIDGIKNASSKHDTYKVHRATTEKEIVFTAFRGRNRLEIHSHMYNQQVAVLSNKEFNSLPILW